MKNRFLYPAFFLLLLLSACGKQAVIYEFTDDESIRLEAQAAAYAPGTRQINWFVINDSGETASYGRPYEVLKKQGKKWIHALPVYEKGVEYAWTDDLITVAPGERRGGSLDVSSLAEGFYRLVKEINRQYYALDFAICKDGVTEEDALRTEDPAVFLENVTAGVRTVLELGDTQVSYLVPSAGAPYFVTNDNPSRWYACLITDGTDIFLADVSSIALAGVYELPEDGLRCILKNPGAELCAAVPASESGPGRYCACSPSGESAAYLMQDEDAAGIAFGFLRDGREWYYTMMEYLDEDRKPLGGKWSDDAIFVLIVEKNGVREEILYQYSEDPPGLPRMTALQEQ